LNQGKRICGPARRRLRHEAIWLNNKRRLAKMVGSFEERHVPSEPCNAEGPGPSFVEWLRPVCFLLRVEPSGKSVLHGGRVRPVRFGVNSHSCDCDRGKPPGTASERFHTGLLGNPAGLGSCGPIGAPRGLALFCRRVLNALLAAHPIQVSCLHKPLRLVLSASERQVASRDSAPPSETVSLSQEAEKIIVPLSQLSLFLAHSGSFQTGNSQPALKGPYPRVRFTVAAIGID
jgi:hypothetical protein